MDEEDIGKQVLDSAFKVHTALGPGMLESAYEACMSYELEKKSLRVLRQPVLPIHYGDIKLDAGYRLDLLVNGKVVVELKSVERLNDVHLAQVVSYLKLGDYKLGYLLNFNVKRMRDGIKRVVNGI